MPYKPHTITKQYYTIGEVGEMLGESPSCLRYWERKFPELRPHKLNQRGERIYNPKELCRMKMVHYLLREELLTLAGVRKRLFA